MKSVYAAASVDKHQNKNLSSLRLELKEKVKRLYLPKVLDIVFAYSQLKDKECIKRIHDFIEANVICSPLVRNDLRCQGISPVLAVLTEYSLFHTNPLKEENESFGHDLSEALLLSFSIMLKSVKPTSPNNQIYLQTREEQFYFRKGGYLIYLSRLLYIYCELPKLYKIDDNKNKIFKNVQFDLEKALNEININILAYRYILLMPHFWDQEKILTFDYLISPQDGIALPASEEEIQAIFEDLSWTKEKYLDKRKHFPNRSTFTFHPLIPYGNNVDQKIILFPEAFINSFHNLLFFKLFVHQTENKTQFSSWLGHGIEHYCGQILEHSFQQQKGLTVYGEEGIINLTDINDKKKRDDFNKQRADFIIKDENLNLIVVIEVKTPIKNRKPFTYGLAENQTNEEKKVLDPIIQSIGQIQNTIDKFKENNPNTIYRYLGISIGWEDIFPQSILKKKLKEKVSHDFEWYCIPLNVLEFSNSLFRNGQWSLMDFANNLRVGDDFSHYNNEMRERYGDHFKDSFLYPFFERFLNELHPDFSSQTTNR